MKRLAIFLIARLRLERYKIGALGLGGLMVVTGCQLALYFNASSGTLSTVLGWSSITAVAVFGFESVRRQCLYELLATSAVVAIFAYGVGGLTHAEYALRLWGLTTPLALGTALVAFTKDGTKQFKGIFQAIDQAIETGAGFVAALLVGVASRLRRGGNRPSTSTVSN